MDDRRFDRWAKNVGAGASRRALLKGMLGLGGTLAATRVGTHDAAAQWSVLVCLPDGAGGYTQRLVPKASVPLYVNRYGPSCRKMALVRRHRSAMTCSPAPASHLPVRPGQSASASTNHSIRPAAAKRIPPAKPVSAQAPAIATTQVTAAGRAGTPITPVAPRFSRTSHRIVAGIRSNRLAGFTICGNPFPIRTTAIGATPPAPSNASCRLRAPKTAVIWLAGR